MFDHLRENGDFGVVVVVIGRRLLDLRDELLGSGMLDFRLVVYFLVFGRVEERGIEDFFLYRGVYPQCLADLRRQRVLALLVAGLLELLEPVLYLAVIGLE